MPLKRKFETSLFFENTKALIWTLVEFERIIIFEDKLKDSHVNLLNHFKPNFRNKVLFLNSFYTFFF